MRLRKRSVLTVEQLEARWVPAMTSSFNGTTLFLGNGTVPGGTPAVNGGSPRLRVTINPDGTVDAGEGASLNNLADDVNASFISIRLSNVASRTQVLLGGNTFNGSITYRAGNGNDTFSLQNNGTLAGNLTVITGTGADSITFTTGGASTIGTSVNVQTGAGADEFIMTNVSVGGNVALDGLNTVQLQSLDPSPVSIGGSLTMRAGTENQVNFWDLAPSLTITGSVNASSQNFNLINSDTVLVAADVGGNVIVSLGNGVNNTTIDSTAEITGAVVISGGGGDDNVQFLLTGQIFGNVTMSLGDGQNSFFLDEDFFIGGTQVTYIGGAGIDDVTLLGQAAGAKMVAFLGAGNDELDWGDGVGLPVTFLSAYLDGGFGVNVLNIIDPTPFPFTYKNFV